MLMRVVIDIVCIDPCHLVCSGEHTNGGLSLYIGDSHFVVL